MQVELVSPERILFSGEAEMVILRAAGGDIAFLENHAPFLGAVDIGVVRIIGSGQSEERAAVHGGFVEVRDNRVIILSDVAELASQVDVERAREAQRRAEEQMRGEHDAECDAALRRAHVRLEVVNG
ncbi:MAG: ATP synthase F1 subunit epsilon [Actinobacteria bacterium]|nr:ATP synthase F1 subunit epsilon [Actinomycetota bacterium]